MSEVVTINDEEITPVEVTDRCGDVQRAIAAVQDRGEKYFFWHGDLVSVQNWREAICEVKWKKSEFDSHEEVSLAYWKEGFRYEGNIERLRNLAGRTHY